MQKNLSESTKPLILFICNYYLPGFKAGGGLRTIVNTIERFSDKFDFFVITLDHDGDNIMYDSIKVEEWNEVNHAKVFYLPANKTKIYKIRQLIKEIQPQVIYLNSVFSELSIYFLTLRKLGLIDKIPVIIAPEGELSKGALQLKALKKNVFIKFVQTTDLFQDLIWKVTAEPEKIESIKFKRNNIDVFVAPNLPSKTLFQDYDESKKIHKSIGEAKMVFLSRFGRKKNLKWLVDIIRDIKGDLTLDIYGPLEDKTYWEETVNTINTLPSNIKVVYKGEVIYEEVLKVLYQYHFFVLPTLGENFGHVFIEALAAGCPLIISDTTPWRGLEEKEVGWDLPLENPGIWIDKINQCIQLDQVNYSKLSQNARLFASNWLNDPKVEENTLKVLEFALDSKR